MLESKLSSKGDQDFFFFTYKDFSSNNIKASKSVIKKKRKYIFYSFFNRNTIYKIIVKDIVKENKDTGFISALTGGTKIAD